MCFSARVRQSLSDLIRKFGATVDWEGFELLFRRRLEDGTIKIARALEDNFVEPSNPVAEKTQEHILAYRRVQAAAWEADLFKQKKRLGDATRSLQLKETKKAREHVRIATDKIENYLEGLSDLKRTESRANDGRIFPMTFVANEQGRRVIRPMRLHLPSRRKACDVRSEVPGTYNARRDNLESFWSQV